MIFEIDITTLFSPDCQVPRGVLTAHTHQDKPFQFNSLKLFRADTVFKVSLLYSFICASVVFT